MALNLVKTVFDCLKGRPNEKLTARQIAEWIFATFPDECQAKKARSQSLSSDVELVQQLVAEIGSKRPQFQKKHPELKTTEGRPRQYYYSSMSDSDEVVAAESSQPTKKSGENDAKLSEHDLYPRLSRYLWDEFGIYPKRIDEKRSSNKHGQNGNRWLYPDIVGLEDLGRDWSQELQDCVRQYSDKRTKLWSFEVKLLLNRSNVRECFFQAVSNSSWANFGYLVAAEISGSGIEKELRLLSTAHGIGIIWLNRENPAESEVRIPARERIEIDWDTANRVASENNDFMGYVKRIKQFYQTGEVHLVDWDVPLDSGD